MTRGVPTVGRTVELDVRAFQERGEEPFETIMAAIQGLGTEDTLVLINTFEPLPLYRVMEGKGFQHRAEQVEPGTWRVLFSRGKR